MAELSAGCAFDPLERVENLVFALPALKYARDPGRYQDYGLVAVGHLAAGPLLACATAQVKNRGGRVSLIRIGTFQSLRVPDRGGELAVRSGLLLLGGGAYLRDMIDAAESRAPSLLENPLHTALRKELGAGALVASWVPDAGWAERQGAEEGSILSPLRHVRALGLRIDVAPKFEVKLLLGCVGAERCKEVLRLAEQLRQEASPELERRLRVRLLDSRVWARNNQVWWSAALPQREARAALLAFLSELGFSTAH
jgi:hypothetical protein